MINNEGFLEVDVSLFSAQQERKWFIDLFFTSPFCIAIFEGPNHKFEMANPSLLQYIGHRDYKGKNISKVLPELVEQGIVQEMDEVFKTKKSSFSQERLIKFPDKEGDLKSFFFDFIYKVHQNGNGQKTGLLLFATDVTEKVKLRRKFQENEKLLLEAQKIGNLGSFKIDLIQKHCTVSPEFRAIFEVPVDQALTLEDLFILIPQKRLDHTYSVVNYYPYEESFSFNHKYCSKNGKAKFLYTKGRTTYDTEGLRVQIVGVTQDITERKKIEIELDGKNVALSKTQRELNTFLYSAAHDLRGPITSILGLIEIMEDDPDVCKISFIDFIKQSTKKMDNVIARMVDHSFNTESKIKFEKLNLKEVIHDSISPFREVLDHHKFEIIVETESKYDFYSDRKRIITILKNLIANAISFRAAGNIQPVLKIKTISGPNFLTLTISDNGKGMKKKYQKKAFTMFFRSQNSQGSGLGLFVIKEIVEKLGGKVKINSIKGSGTSFIIRLENFLDGQH